MSKFNIGEKVRYDNKIVTISEIEEYFIFKNEIIYNFLENPEHTWYTETCFRILIRCPEYLK